MNVIVIGAGRRGKAHAHAALACGARVAAVYDPDTDRARALAAEISGQAVPDLSALFDGRPDLAVITSPPPLHAEQAVAALRSGCHVVLEKPIALTMVEAREIGRAAEIAGRRVYVCQQQRHTLAAERAREALRGRKVALAHIWLYRPAPDIRGNWDRAWGGGHVVEWAIHPIDVCRYVMGDVETVFAAYADQVLAGTDGWNNWDAYACTLRFANGAVGAVATTYAAWPGGGGGFGLDIVAKGMILRWRAGRLEIATPDGTAEHAESEDATTRLHRAVHQAVRTGDESGIRLHYGDAVRTLATVLACNRSHETGLPVRVADLLED